MSTIIKRTGGLSHIVQTDDGKYHFVDTSYVDFGAGDYYETMSFPYDNERDVVLNYEEEGCAKYDHVADAIRNHDLIIRNLEVFVNG